MVFQKIQKTNSYFSRRQPDFRRRREGKTDYYARKALIMVDRNKYNASKYRLVVRFTNKDVIAQVVKATMTHDEVICAAYGHEMPRYGVSVGLTNYASAYCVGLLLARRLLKKMNMSQFQGVSKVNGEYFEQEEVEDRSPFRAVLDVGLARTTTGARIFAVLKGAVDGGLAVPHSERRFPGYDGEAKSFDAAVLRKYIMGGHVSDYMTQLKDEEPQRFERQFSRFIKAGIKPTDLEAIYTKAHAAIRKDPEAKKSTKPAPTERKIYRRAKLSLKQRRNRVAQIKAKLAELATAAATE